MGRGIAIAVGKAIIIAIACPPAEAHSIKGQYCKRFYSQTAQPPAEARLHLVPFD